MRIYPEQLLQNLNQKLSSCYMVFGDEPLLCLESISQIKKCAISQGFDETFSFNIDGHFDPDKIFNEFQSLSLFSTKKIIELTLTKTTKENTAFIKEISGYLNPDILLILTGPKLKMQQLNSAWFKSLDQKGIYIPSILPSLQKYPQWISKRLKLNGLHANNEVIDHLCLHFEGNLLAAKQEIEKLALLYPNQALKLEQVEQSITTYNHFSLFQWIDTLLEGDFKRSFRIFWQLKDEGSEPLLLCATLSNEIQKLLKLSYLSKNSPISDLLDKQQPKLWPAKQQIVKKALLRLGTSELEALVIQCSEIEILIKVENYNQPWLELEKICLSFLGLDLCPKKN